MSGGPGAQAEEAAALGQQPWGGMTRHGAAWGGCAAVSAVRQQWQQCAMCGVQSCEVLGGARVWACGVDIVPHWLTCLLTSPPGHPHRHTPRYPPPSCMEPPDPTSILTLPSSPLIPCAQCSSLKAVYYLTMAGYTKVAHMKVRGGQGGRQWGWRGGAVGWRRVEGGQWGGGGAVGWRGATEAEAWVGRWRCRGEVEGGTRKGRAARLPATPRPLPSHPCAREALLRLLPLPS